MNETEARRWLRHRYGKHWITNGTDVVGFFVTGGRLVKRAFTEQIHSTDTDLGAIDITKSPADSLRGLPIEAPIWFVAMREAIKLARAEAAIKTWEDVVGPAIEKWAQSVFRDFDASCQDNHRVARIDKSSQVRRFKKQEADGCCGSWSVKRVGPDGHTYLLGCNYGH